MRRFNAIIYLLFSGILLIGCGRDRVIKSNDTGFISGRITIDGVAAAQSNGVTITVYPYVIIGGNPKSENYQVQSSVTENGDYRIELISGTYKLTFGIVNYQYGSQSTSRYPIEVTSGRTTILDVEMREPRPVNLLAYENDAYVVLSYEGAYNSSEVICYRCSADSAVFHPVDTLYSNNSRIITDVPPSVGTFRYRLTSIISSSESQPSNEVRVEFLGEPTMPTGLNISDMINYVDLSWRTGNSRNTYKVYRSETGDEWSLVCTTDRSYYYDTLAVLGTYYYRITSLSEFGFESNPTSAIRIDFDGRPDPPTNVRATDCGSFLQINWDNSTSNIAYNIYRAYGADSNYVIVGLIQGNDTFQDRPTNYGTYRYQVTSVVNGSNESDRSATVLVDYDGYLDPPRDLSAHSLGLTVQINWSSVYAASYALYRSADSGQTYGFVSSQNSNSFTDRPTTPGYLVYAVTSVADNGNESARSVPVGVYYENIIPPPISVSANSHGRSVTISWYVVSDAAGYQIFRASEPVGNYTMLADYVSNTSYIDIPDSAGYYYYKVKAFSSMGQISDYSSIASTYCIARPLPPSSLRAEDHLYNIQLNWNTEGSYNVIIYRAFAPFGQYTPIDSVFGSTYSDWPVESRVYYYKLQSKQDGRYSDTSYYVGTYFSARIGAPRNYYCLDNGAYVTYAWYSVEGASKYYVYRGTNPDTMGWIGEATESGFNDWPPSGGRYYYRASAVTRGGLESPQSLPDSVDFIP